ncbi:hypothetical protein ACQ86N_22490 [Puia sp. P3]|uniref:hypothetical protein n=1 Tax=Puia sp. P3 TaxID=3423952 RepID=UPI003D67806F
MDLKYLYDLGRDLGIFTVASLLIKQFIQSSADKSIAQHKNQLDILLSSHQLNLNTNLERYKAELNLRATRQTYLHEKRLEVIAELYTKLINLVSALQEMTRRIHPVIENAEAEEQQRVAAAHKAYAEYNNYYFYHKLYFTKAVGDLLENIRGQYHSVTWDYWEPRRLQEIAGGRLPSNELERALETSRQATAKVLKEIPEILEKLEHEFRLLLGVTEPDRQS